MTSNNTGKRILLTGARFLWALDLARLLKASGNEVYACDTTSFHPAKFSNAVTDFFQVGSPKKDLKGYFHSLRGVIKEHKIEMVIPVWEEILYLARHRDQLPPECELFCASFELLHALHHKWEFMELLKSHGIPVPHSVLLTSENALQKFRSPAPYILKRCYSRNSQYFFKVEDNRPPPIHVAPGNPWIAQEWIDGAHFCSYSVCREGKVLAHTVYPVNYTLNGHSCVAFEAVPHPGILVWIKNLMQKLAFTGHIAFDFIETKNGELFAIECNPRGTSGIHLFRPEDQLGLAFTGNPQSTLTPKTGNSQQIALGMLLFGLKEGIVEKRLPEYLRKLLTTKDVVFNLRDIKPFLAEPFILASYWTQSKKQNRSIPEAFMHDLEWDETVVESPRETLSEVGKER